MGAALHPISHWFTVSSRSEWETYTPKPHNHQHNQHGHDRHTNHRGEYNSRNRYAHVVEDGSGPMGEFSFHKSGPDSASPGGGYLTGFQGVRRRDAERAERSEGGRGGFRKYEDRGMSGAHGGEGRSPTDAEGFGRGASKRSGHEYDSSNSLTLMMCWQATCASPRQARIHLASCRPVVPSSQLAERSATLLQTKGCVSLYRRVSCACLSGLTFDAHAAPQGFPLGTRMASYGRNDREGAQLDENGRPIRSSRNGKDAGTQRERDQRSRRQDVGDESLDGGEWETVPRSPETERRLARTGGLADSASDWRKGSGAGASGLSRRGNEVPAGRGATRSARNDADGSRRGQTGGSSSFPPWMADANETPTWMDDSPSTSTSGEKRERGKLNFDAFKSSEIHVTPMEGEDSIQAFKREMKRREAEAKAREAGGSSSHGPPPGLSRPKDAAEASREEEEARPTKPQGLRPPGLFREASDGQREAVDAGAPDSSSLVANTSEQNAAAAPPSSASAAAQDSGSAGRGASRFTRFFPQTIDRAREAQERAMAAHAANTSGSSVPPPPGLHESDGKGLGNAAPNAGNASADMAALFANMGVNQPQRGNEPHHAGQEQDRGGQPPSEADVQGMQKIMAMLRGGGGGVGGEAPAIGQGGAVGSPNASNAASANLMAMLAGGAMSQSRGEAPPSPSAQQQRQHAPTQRQSVQHAPPGLDISRLAGGGSGAGAGDRASPAPARSQSPGVPFGGSGVSNRSSSPGVQFRNDRAGAPQQYPAQSPGPYGNAPPPPGFGPPQGGRPGSGFGMDPRSMNVSSPNMRNTNGLDSSSGSGNGGGDGHSGGGGGGGGPSLANLPPHIQQQLMGLPPHVQHAVLSGHPRGPPPPPGGPPPFGHPQMQGMPPPPPGMGGPPGGPPHHLGPFGPPPPFGLPPFLAGHQGPYGGGSVGNGGGNSPGMPPHLGPYGASPNPGHATMSPHPQAVSPGGGPPPGGGNSSGGYPPGMMQGPPGFYGGRGGR